MLKIVYMRDCINYTKVYAKNSLSEERSSKESQHRYMLPICVYRGRTQ